MIIKMITHLVTLDRNFIRIGPIYCIPVKYMQELLCSIILINNGLLGWM